MFTIECKPERKLFPPAKFDEIGFMLCTYTAENQSDIPEKASGENEKVFTAKGPLLPYTKGSLVTLYGEWEEGKDGRLCLSVSRYEQYLPDTPPSAMCFLQDCGMEKNESRVMLDRISSFSPLAAIDERPSLIDDVVRNKYRAGEIRKNYLIRREKNEVFFYLLPFFAKHGGAVRAAESALTVEDLYSVKAFPFRYVVNGALPYQVAAKIAKENKVPNSSEDGISAAIIEATLQSEGSSSSYVDEGSPVGNTFCTVEDIIDKVKQLLRMKEDNGTDFIIDGINRLIGEDVLVCAKGQYIYRKPTACAEYGIADEIARLMRCDIEDRDYKEDIYCLENKKRMRLAPEQRAAVKVALKNPVSLLIGGPGCGKTTIEQFIISVYRLYHNDNVLLVAPTGKAARRMSEATGEPACTIHHALGVSAGQEVLVTDTVLDAGLILVDEASMLDSQVAFALLKAIKTGTQVLLVGDTNQLPSVGAGNVLSELIASNVVPVAALETVYRQKAGSTIAVNCARIKRGSTCLEYSDTFQFVQAESQADAAREILDIFRSELNSGLSLDDICILSPYRKSTETGVNMINPQLQAVAPHKEDCASVTYGKRVFYEGDKVIMMNNKDEVANGDVGFITEIAKSNVTIDFMDGRVVSYTKPEMKNFELAFATTIHKSQGSEYRTCIIVLMDEHRAMLKRNLIYTAVSRAKNKVILVGTNKALETAIVTEDAAKRRSRLSTILRQTITPQM